MQLHSSGHLHVMACTTDNDPMQPSGTTSLPPDRPCISDLLFPASLYRSPPPPLSLHPSLPLPLEISPHPSLPSPSLSILSLPLRHPFASLSPRPALSFSAFQHLPTSVLYNRPSPNLFLKEMRRRLEHDKGSAELVLGS